MNIALQTDEGHEFVAYMARPEGAPRACVIVLHEAFGVTPHIRNVADGFAADGYLAIAPTLFSWAAARREGVVLPVNADGLEQGRVLITATQPLQILATVQACVDWTLGQGLAPLVAGYCWGGSCAYFAASHISRLAACSCYYGGKLADIVKEAQARCPAIVHLATLDRYIPLDETVEAFRRHDPRTPVYVYEADHGFNRDDGKTFDAAASALARRRTLELFEKSISNQ